MLKVRAPEEEEEKDDDDDDPLPVNTGPYLSVSSFT
jgi:hypothetical protein